MEIEPDSYDTDRTLNLTLTKALVDPWQYNRTTTTLPIPEKSITKPSEDENLWSC